jgi:hypothetical protein
VEALLDELRSRASRKELVCASKTCSEAAFRLYLISSFDEVVVSRLAGRVRSTRQRVSLIKRSEPGRESESLRFEELIDWRYPTFSMESGNGCCPPDWQYSSHRLVHGFVHSLYEMRVA